MTRSLIVNRQQTRRTAGPFAHRVQQTQTLLDNRLFIQNLTAQGREGCTQALSFFHHKLRCALFRGNIRQATGGNHPVGDSLLLLKQGLKACQFAIRAVGMNMGQTRIVLSRGFQPEIRQAVLLVKQEAQSFRQYRVVNVRTIQQYLAARW